MATIPVYTTFTAGTILTAAQLNTQVVTAGNFWLARPYCDVENTTGPNLATGVALLLPWDTENEDNDAMHSTVSNSSRVIFQTLGAFRIHYYVRVGVPGTVWTSGVQINLRLNAAGASGGGSSLSTTTYNPTDSHGSSNTQVERVVMYRALNVGDYYEVFVTGSFTGAAPGIQTGNRVSGTTAMWEIA